MNHKQHQTSVNDLRPCDIVQKNVQVLTNYDPVLNVGHAKCTDLSFEAEFLQVAVKRGLGRRTLNDFLHVLNKFDKGNFPADARACVGSLRQVPVDIVAPGQYYHFGLKTCIIRVLKYLESDSRQIRLQFNIDGTPISSSSTLAFWPILARVFVNDFKSSVVLVGLYCGDKKPYDVTVYLNPLINELLDLCEHGISLSGASFVVSVHSFVCDAPARQFIKCIKSHNAYNCCERCTIEGQHRGGSVRFLPEEGISMRSNESFRQKLDEDHHSEGQSTPLTRLDMDLVRDFPLDYMHLILLGVVKKFLGSWMGFNTRITEFSTLHRLGASQKSIMNIRALKMAKRVTVEFQRKPRSFTFLGMFKATEFRSFLCYTCPFIMQGVFDYTVVFNHFMCLVVAMRILLTPNKSENSIELARECIKLFVSRAKDIYGPNVMVYNVHSTLHLVDDYVRFGSLDHVSCFPYESFLSKLKSYIRKPGKQLAQVVKRVHEQCNFDLPPEPAQRSAKLKYKHFNGPTGCYNSADIVQFQEVIFLRKCIRLNSADDVIFCSFGYARVVNILKLRDHVLLLVRVYSKISECFSYPCNSSRVGIVFVEALKSEVIAIYIRDSTKC